MNLEHGGGGSIMFRVFMCICSLFSRLVGACFLFIFLLQKKWEEFRNKIPLYLFGYLFMYLYSSKSLIMGIFDVFCFSLQTMSTTLDNLNRDEDAYVGMIEEKKVSPRAFLPVGV